MKSESPPIKFPCASTFDFVISTSSVPPPGNGILAFPSVGASNLGKGASPPKALSNGFNVSSTASCSPGILLKPDSIPSAIGLRILSCSMSIALIATSSAKLVILIFTYINITTFFFLFIQ